MSKRYYQPQVADLREAGRGEASGSERLPRTSRRNIHERNLRDEKSQSRRRDRRATSPNRIRSINETGSRPSAALRQEVRECRRRNEGETTVSSGSKSKETARGKRDRALTSVRLQVVRLTAVKVRLGQHRERVRGCPARGSCRPRGEAEA